MSGQITVYISLTEEEAEALAFLAKRIGYSDLVNFSSCSGETYSMVRSMAKLRKALSDSGIDLR